LNHGTPPIFTTTAISCGTWTVGVAAGVRRGTVKGDDAQPVAINDPAMSRTHAKASDLYVLT
jgi:hypothetical protein